MKRLFSTHSPTAPNASRRTSRGIRGLMLVLALLAGIVLTLRDALGATVTVDTTNDTVDGNTSSIANLIATPGADGFISLREAITASNNTTGGPHTINFNISGCGGVCTITPASALPAITTAVTIDGWSQPGWSSAPLIELNGTSAGASNGLQLNVGGNTIRGLTINRFGQYGIYVSTGANGNTIQGNYLGTSNTGLVDQGNSLSGIVLDGSSNNQIGGTTATQRNVISGNGSTNTTNRYGIQIQTSANSNTIEGNYIGLGADGSTALGNSSFGVHIESSSSNTIGGTASGAGNTISSNGNTGIRVHQAASSGNVILGNTIGLATDGSTDRGNGTDGIEINLAVGTQVGDGTAQGRNIISGNGRHGIFGFSASSSTIKGNYIGTNAAGTAAVSNANHGITHAGSVQIGGTAAGEGNLVSGNGGTGIAAGTGNVVQGNTIGTNAAGTAAIANGSRGITVNGSATIGGTASGAGNLISGNSGQGIYFTNTAGSGYSATVQGNIIGLDITGVSAIHNTGGSISIDNFDAVTVGGTTAAARNLMVAPAGQWVVIITGPGTHSIKGNTLGANINGTAISGHLRTLQVSDTSTNVTIGGTEAGAGNLITGSANQGVVIQGNTSRASILGNSIKGNGSIGIDVYSPSGGVSANDGSKSETSANRGMDFPVFTSAALDGTTLYVTGYVGSAPNQSTFASSRVEVFLSDNDSSGYGEGSAYLGYVTADASGNFDGSFTVASALSVGDKVTGTATDTGSPTATSEFSANFTVTQILSVRGTVFEDRHYGGGAGRDKATALGDGGAGRSGARVELYDNSGAFLSSTTTDANGDYVFSPLSAGSYTVRVVNETVASGRTGYTGSLRAVQTFRTNASSGAAVSVTDYVGGQTPNLVDAGSNLSSATLASLTAGSATPQSITTATISTDSITGVDFGYSFNVVVNTNDSGQGSLRQMMLNANALGNTGLAINGRTAGIDHAIFMISNGSAAAGLRAANNYFSSGVASVAPASALPAITEALVIDAQTQPGWTSAPIIELNGTSAGGGSHGLFLSASGNTVSGLAVNRFGQSGIYIHTNANNNNIQGNYIGLGANGTTAYANSGSGIYLNTSSGNTLGGTTATTGNVIGSNSSSGIFIDQVGSSNNTIIGNLIGLASDGSTDRGNAYFGIHLSGPSNTQIGNGTAAGRNIISGNDWSGIYNVNATNTTVIGNYIGTDATGSVAVPNSNHGITTFGTNSIQIGGTTAGQGNLISGNAQSGISTSSNATATVQGNTIGANAAGSAAVPNGLNGIDVNSSITIGGTAAGAGNLISGNTGSGILFQNTLGSGYTANVQGNIIGLDSSGLAALHNGGNGIYIAYHDNVTVGGITAAARNVISASTGDYPLYIQGSGTYTIQGNYIGTDINGTALGAGFYNVLLWDATNTTLGGTTAGAGNLIKGSVNQGVYVLGATTRVAILGNSIESNGNLGIDIAPTGVSANNGSKSESIANREMDFPIFTSAMYDGASTLYVTGYVGSAANQSTFAGARVEVFISDEDASGYGEGKTYLGYVTTDASGNFDGSFVPAVAVSAGQKVTGTATDTGSPPATSEFGPNITVTRINVSGTVFEDRHYGGGAGRNKTTALADGGSRRSGARVELYDNTGAFVASTTTDASGNYRFMGNTPGAFTVRVVNETVTSSRTGYTAALRAVQTFRTNGSSGTAVAVTDYVGGETPNLVDAGSNLTSATLASLTTGSTTAQSITTIDDTAAAVSNVDFGYSFNVIVNTKDSGQGSLRQFMTNANALGNTGLAINGRTAGIDHAIFMISNGTADPGLRVANNYFSAGVASIAPASALPTITEAVVIDAQTQPGWSSAPIIELNGTGAGAGSNGLNLNTSGNTISGLAINRFTQNGIYIGIGANNNTIRGCYIGLGADGSTAYPNGNHGVYIYSAANNTVGGTAANTANVISSNGASGITVDQAGSTGASILGNIIGLASDGTTTRGNTDYGIYVANTLNTQIGNGTAAGRNIISGNLKDGIYNYHSTGTSVIGNYIGTDSSGTVGKGNQWRGVQTFGSNSISVGGASAGHGNIISGNGLDGVSLIASTSAFVHTVQGNKIGTNASGNAAIPNGLDGISVASSATIGGTAAGAGNLISGNTRNGIIFTNTIGQGKNLVTSVAGNIIGLDATGLSALYNNLRGIEINSYDAITIGGTTAAARNIIVSNPTQYSLYIRGAGSYTAQGNYIGTDINGAALGSAIYSVFIWDATNTTLGGTAAGAGNLIKGAANQGVMVQGATTRASILGNSIQGNAALGIDIHPSGVTANNGSKSESLPNRDMDYPVFTSAAYDGSMLFVTGYVGSAPSQSTFANARVEVFVSDNDASGYGEGKTYLGYVTADANGNFDGSFTPAGAVSVGEKVTGTATDTEAIPATSEFGPNITVLRMNVVGTVFEDRNYGGGAGRNRATALADGGSNRSGARVELYDNTGAFVDSTTTDASGNYRFMGNTPGVYTVRVVNETVTSSRTGYTAALRAVQTFRTNGSSGTAVAVTDHVGGETPNLVDAGSNLTSATLASLTAGTATPQSITTIDDTAAAVTGADFGYSFNVVINANDTGQGSLRQFILNANALGNTGLAINGRTAGIDHAIFMISNGTAAAGLRSANNYFSGGIASIAPASELPALTEALVIDAQTQPGWSSAPIIEFDGSSAGASDGLQLDVGGNTLRGLIINRFTQYGIHIEINANGNTIQGNYLGTSNTGLVDQGNTLSGIVLVGSSNNHIGGTTAAQRNVISGNGSINEINRDGIQIVNSNSNTVEGNYIGLGADGSTALGNSHYGIHIDKSSSNTIGGTASGAGNTIASNGNSGIQISQASASGNVILGNTIGLATDGSTARGNGVDGIDIGYGVNTQVGNGTAQGRNVISANGRHGIYSYSASNSTIQGNYIGTNAAGTAAVGNTSSGLTHGGPAQIGGTGAGEGNLVSGNGGTGIGVGSGDVVQGNIIGTNAAGTAALANGSRGITVNGSATIGGTAAGAGNLISGNTGEGIYFGNTAGSGYSATVQGNIIGLDSTGVNAIHNTGGSIFIDNFDAVTLGGTTEAARNLMVAPAGQSVVLITGPGTHSLKGNTLGANINGTAISGHSRTLQVNSTSTNITIGGSEAGAGNLITGSANQGVVIQGNTSRASILGNSIKGNGSIGIDVYSPSGGVSANDGSKSEASANRGMDYPVFTSAAYDGGTLYVTGYVGSAAGQSTFASARVEVFVSDEDASGYGEGQTYLGYVTADANGNFDGSFTPAGAVAVGNKVTGTATDTEAIPATSEFGPQFTVTQPQFTVSGTVFEDVNYGGGAGRDKTAALAAGGSGRGGARVELYDNTGAYVDSSTTNGSGVYAFGPIDAGTYTIRVVNETVSSARTGYSSSLRAVQTFRTNASSGSAVAVTDTVGGETPNLLDAGSNLTSATLASLTTGSTTAQSITTVTKTIGTVNNVDFGYSFNAVVNTNDSGQGSLRQFITNANTLSNSGVAISGRTASIDHAIFMISNGTAAAGLRAANNYFTAGVASIAPASALPTITEALVVDGQTQPGWSSAPIIELNGTSAGAGSHGLQLTASGNTLRGLVINRFGQNGIYLNSANTNTIAGNTIGLGADGSTAQGNGGHGIQIYQSSSNTIGGTTANTANIISSNAVSGILVDQATSTNNTIVGNLIGVASDGSTDRGNTINGIHISSADATTIGNGAVSGRNIISGNGWHGVYSVNSTNTLVIGNYIGTDVNGTTAVSNGLSGVSVTGIGSAQIGGSTAGQGNLLSGNTQYGVSTGGTGSFTVQGNIIGANAAGTAAVPNGIHGIDVNSSVTIGGTASGAGNLISGNIGTGILFENTLGQGYTATVEGNTIGLDSTGLAALHNGGHGIHIYYHDNVTVGGTTAAARNVISTSAGDYPLYVQGSGSHTIQGNYIGTDVNGTALGAGFYNVLLWDATNTTLGGTAAGAGNLIKGSVNQGVYVLGATTRVAILGNSIEGNGNLGIDLAPAGVTANNGTKSESLPNRDMDYPVLTSADYDGTTLYVAGYIGSAPSQNTFANARVEIFLSDEDATGYGEGKTYLGYLTADADGNFDGSFTPAAAVVVGNKITATATDTGSPQATSEFGANVAIQRLNFSGTVFEDVNYSGGAGRNKTAALADGGSGREGARVELYDNTGAFVTSTTTNSAGSYRFASQATGTYTVRVVNETVSSARTGYTGSLRAVQTYRTDASGGSAAEVTDYVGGQTPNLVDAGSNLSSATLASLTAGSATAQSIATAVDSGSAIANVDFGYSFNVVVNTNDSGQGSLRQFMLNANALGNTGLAINGRTAGIDHAIFMISNGTAAAGLRSANNYFSGGIASIAPSSALPALTEAAVIDAQTQPGWSSAPIIELNGTSAGSSHGLQLSASGCTVRGLIINRFGQHGIYALSAGSHTLQGNYLGTDATGLVDQGNGLSGIALVLSSSNTVGGSTASARNVIAGNGAVDDINRHGILIGLSANSNAIEGNYIGIGADGSTALPNSRNGIYIDSASNNTIGGSTAGQRNIISGNGTEGVYASDASNTTVQGNYIGTNAAGTAAVANGAQGLRLTGSTSALIGGTSAGQGNVISGNTSHGLATSGAGSYTVQGNVMGTNAAGAAALANGGRGVSVGSSITLGGTAAGAGNVISGNTGDGIYLENTAGSGYTATVQANYVGLDVSGVSALTNAGHAINVDHYDNTQIGSTAAAGRNLVAAAASQAALRIDGGGTHVAEGNRLGANVNGDAVGSALNNVLLVDATNITIGGTAAGAGNLIKGASSQGVLVQGATTRAAILGNAIEANTSLGIDLDPAGVTANNNSKSESLPNREMDFPVFTNASYDGSLLRVRGYVGTAAGQSLFADARIEIFVSDEDASGYGEGKTFLGALTADANGNFFGQITTASVVVGNKLTATATDTDSPPATSEFGPSYDVRDYRPFRNGSFEDGDLGATSNFGDGNYWALAVANTDIDYWVVENAAINAMPGTHWNASHGVRSIDLNHDSGSGAISQTFDTNVGTTYVVFVDYSGSAACGPTRKSLRISAAGTSTDVTSYLVGGGAVIPTLPASGRDYDIYYDTALLYFTAVTDLTTLKFESLSTGLCGPVIDNVRVQAADPFTNGSFESGTDPGAVSTLMSGSTDVTQWLVGGHSVDYVGSQWTAANGSRSVELDGTGVGSIAQTFDALPETYYRARFALSADPNGVGTRALNASAAAAAESFSSSNTSNPLAWSEEAFVFRATDISTTLDFASLSGSCCTGPVVDNVRLEVAYPFINGSFEDVRFPLRDSTNLTGDNKLIRGWITSGTSLQHWGSATFTPSLGSYSIHLNGPSGAGAIEHTFDVEAGQSYDILFDAAANPALAANQTMLASIIDNGSTIATNTVTLNPAAVLTGQTRWRTQQISFTAVTSRVTLKFESQTAGTVGLAVDNVRYGVAGTMNTTGQFNAFETDTAPSAVTGVIKTKIVNQSFDLDIAALRFDKTGYSNYPMSDVKIELLNASDDGSGLDEITNCRASWTPISTVTTTFEFTGPDNGRKTQSFTVNNAYKNVRVKISYPATGTPTIVGCSNDNFAVRPAYFNGFTASDDDDSTAGTARLLNNSGAGGVVHRAGRPFTVVAQAIDGGASTVTNYDGAPQLSVVTCAVPTGCTAGALSGTASATNGIVTGNAFTYAEAGSITVQLVDATYADVDAGDSSQAERTIQLAAAATVGRFIPDRYALTAATSPLMAHGLCGAGPSVQSFTFIGQNFSFGTAPIVRATPLNAAGTALNNARPSFGASHVTTTFTSPSAPVALNGTASINSVSTGSDALINYATSTFSFTRDANTPVATFDATFTLTVDVSDTTETGATTPINSESTLTISSIGFGGGNGNAQHYGRLLLRPGYADLRSDLYLPIEVQRYTTVGWQTLPASANCVSATASAFAYSQATGLVSDGAGNSNCSSYIGTGITTANGRASAQIPKPTGGPVPSAMTVTLNVDAAAGTTCSAPGSSAPATSANIPWLLGPGGAAPSARISWGAPRSEYLLLRERYD